MYSEQGGSNYSWSSNLIYFEIPSGLSVMEYRVSEYKSMDVSKEIYYSVPFLACKMAAAVHTRPELELSKEGRTVRSGRSSC